MAQGSVCRASGPFRGRAAAWIAGPAVAVLLAAPRADAQYAYDPSAADELAKPGSLYFGSAKDDRGKYVSAATIVLETSASNFVLITNEQGRFRAKLPLGTQPGDVRPSCSKPGYQVLRITKRPAPGGDKSAVQVDCLMRRQVPD